MLECKPVNVCFDVIFVLWLFPFSAEDEEDTIAAQEKVEGNVDHAEELDDLAREGARFFFIFMHKTENVFQVPFPSVKSCWYS